MKKVDLGVLLWPSIRSVAYFSIFKKLGICPAEIYVLNGSFESVLTNLKSEDTQYDYSSQFFDLNFDIESFIQKESISVNRIDSSDINSPEVLEVIKNSTCQFTLFTGGGILKKELLRESKFIHIHPGVLPAYRGSTCFYYSILSDQYLGSTAIFMDENIDTGDTIVDSKFRINYRISPDQPLFMDYILDSFIRAYTLEKVLKSLRDENTIDSFPQIRSETPAYYVMHPMLRHMAIDRINTFFDSNKEIGIIEIR